MLSDLLTEDLVQLNVVASNWEDAIRKSAQPLVDNKKVTEGYVDDIIKGVNELGPYIVITEHVALPHARPESGALESAVGITVLSLDWKIILFDDLVDLDLEHHGRTHTCTAANQCVELLISHYNLPSFAWTRSTTSFGD